MLRKFIPKTIQAKILIVFVLFGISLPMFDDSVFPDGVRRCGTITEKMVVPKGRSEADLVFGVQFPNEFKAIDVNKTTFMKFNVGDDACFILPPKVSVFEGIMLLYVMFAWIVVFLFITYYLAQLL